MNRLSLEARMNTRLLTGITAYLVVFSVALGLLLVRGLTKEFDRALISRAEGIIAIARQELAAAPAGTDSLPGFQGMQLGLFALWLSDGSLVGTPGALDALDVKVDQELSDEPMFANLKLPDGRSARKVEIDFVPRQDAAQAQLPSEVGIGAERTATLVIAESRESLDRQILRVSLLVVGACVLLLCSLALLVRQSLHRGLEPVVGLRRQVELLGPDSTVHRVSLRDPPEELAPVLQGINELLRRRDVERQVTDSPAASDMAQAS